MLNSFCKSEQKQQKLNIQSSNFLQRHMFFDIYCIHRSATTFKDICTYFFLFLLDFLFPTMGFYLPLVFLLSFFPTSHPSVSPQPFTVRGNSAWIRQARIYAHRKDKGTFLRRSHYFRGVYESLRAIFRLQTWLENWCKVLKTGL